VCDCGTDPSSGFHAVWCEVYSKHARERYGMADDKEVIALDLDDSDERSPEFEKSNVCKRCREGIRTVEEALLVELGSDETYLIHATLDCYSSEVEALIDRYHACRRNESCCLTAPPLHTPRLEA
jgi:hypothetical protein